VLGVPVLSKTLAGLDSLLSIAQMPGGIPVGTLAIGEAGAKNAGLLAVRVLARDQPELRAKLHAFHSGLAAKVRADSLRESRQGGATTKNTKGTKGKKRR
jgi:5-(carboxyamino)imidazole ribonucleotide mutase